MRSLRPLLRRLHPHTQELHQFGERCREKLEIGESSAFNALRKKVKNARDYATGKQRAEALELKDGRQEVVGTVTSIREPDDYDVYPQRKMLVTREDGAKLWGSIPRAIDVVDKGRKIQFVATITVKEPGFGFYKRPSKACILTGSNA